MAPGALFTFYLVEQRCKPHTFETYSIQSPILSPVKRKQLFKAEEFMEFVKHGELLKDFD